MRLKSRSLYGDYQWKQSTRDSHPQAQIAQIFFLAAIRSLASMTGLELGLVRNSDRHWHHPESLQRNRDISYYGAFNSLTAITLPRDYKGV